jgi:hypothetical protein
VWWIYGDDGVLGCDGKREREECMLCAGDRGRVRVVGSVALVLRFGPW